jgi:hypothetical protein
MRMVRIMIGIAGASGVPGAAGPTGPTGPSGTLGVRPGAVTVIGAPLPFNVTCSSPMVDASAIAYIAMPHQ